MNVILKRQIGNYRYAVAKTIFLKVYKDLYILIEDIKESNCIKVKNIKTNEELYVSIFGKPTINLKNDSSLSIFYETNRGKIDGVQNHVLNDEFKQIYKEAFENAFVSPKKYFEIIDEKYHSIVIYYYKNAIDAILSKKRKVYKYLPLASIDDDKRELKRGVSSFSHPKTFNDPYDCYIVLKNNPNVQDFFRVLCLTRQYDNILMWSYYADSHKGYCFEYDVEDILKEIQNSPINGLCVYSDVEYEKEIELKNPVKEFSYEDINHYIKAVFIKYKEWGHERESRFVMIAKDYKNYEEKGGFIKIKPGIKQIYKGCVEDEKKLLNSDGKEMPSIQMKKDENKYKLYY